MNADFILLVLDKLIMLHGSRSINQSVMDGIVQHGSEIERIYRECSPRNDGDPIPVAKDREHGAAAGAG